MPVLSPDPIQFEQLIEDLSQLTVYSIGRASDNGIVIPNGKISSKHARLIQCTPDSFLLEDLGSRNGSFVDTARITRKIVDRSTSVRLADVNFTVAQLLDLRMLESAKPASQTAPVPTLKPAAAMPGKVPVPAKPVANPLDFTDPFAELKVVFDQYPKLRKDCRSREKMVRTGSIILSSIVGISTAMATGGASALLHVMSGAGLSMLLPTLCSTLLSTEEKLEVIDKEYRERYRCPNPSCRDPFHNREWDLLAQQKTCRRCQAVWVA